MVTNHVLEKKLLLCFLCHYFRPILILHYTNIKCDNIWIKCGFHNCRSKFKVTDDFL